DFVQKAIAARGGNDVRVVTFAAGGRTRAIDKNETTPPPARHAKNGGGTNPSAPPRPPSPPFPSKPLRRGGRPSPAHQNESGARQTDGCARARVAHARAECARRRGGAPRPARPGQGGRAVRSSRRHLLDA